MSTRSAETEDIKWWFVFLSLTSIYQTWTRDQLAITFSFTFKFIALLGSYFTHLTSLTRPVSPVMKGERMLLVASLVTMWQLCHSGPLHIDNHDQRSFSVDVESSARGAAFTSSCLTCECHEEWRHYVTHPTSNIASGNNERDWWMLGANDGVVMTILHETTGSILLKKTFNTWNTFTYAHDLTWWVERVQAGRVVVMAVLRAGTYGLGAALPTLTHLGSLLAPYAPPQALWVWVFVAGGQTFLETIMPNRIPLYNLQTALHAHTIVPTANSIPQLYKTHVDTEHVFLCNNKAAMGPMCDPVNPVVISPEPSMAEKNKNLCDEEEVGVVVCAGGRLQYLAHTLIRLLDNRKISTKVLVAVSTNHSTGVPDPDVLSLVKLFHLNFKVVNTPSDVPSINHRLFQFYRGAWAAGLEAFPNSRYLAFLDEDVEVSRDWLELLLHYAPALEVDASLWCVSGIGAAHINIHSDPHLVVRGSRQPGWGFLVLTAEARAAVKMWPNTSSVSLLYDVFLYTTIGQERECIYPVLSRSRHYGVGVNTLPDIHQFYFLDRPLHDGSSVPLPPFAALTRKTYESLIWSRLSKASIITRNPCAAGFLPSLNTTEPKDFVFYFFLDNPKNSLEWAMLAECVGAWPYSTQDMHQGTVELPQASGGSLWLVGVPSSPFKSLKPSHIPIWHPQSKADFDEQYSFLSSIRPVPNLTNRTLEVATTQLFLQK